MKLSKTIEMIGSTLEHQVLLIKGRENLAFQIVTKELSYTRCFARNCETSGDDPWQVVLDFLQNVREKAVLRRSQFERVDMIYNAIAMSMARGELVDDMFSAEKTR